MNRRYNMQRSDNFPVCSTLELLCENESGRIFIYTGFPVKSAIVAKVFGSEKSEIFPDMNFGERDGFYVVYLNVEPNTVIKFSYQVQ